MARHEHTCMYNVHMYMQRHAHKTVTVHVDQLIWGVKQNAILIDIYTIPPKIAHSDVIGRR